MKEPVTVCSLEYLTGTLATAYKGLITSLVAKDFCMTREDDVIVLKGTVLSMPERSYQAVLKRGGLEASKVELRSGSFELRADSALVGAARNLQIDITQGARHIGTFLLKKEREDECFVSAMELSEELRGVNFRRLTFLLEEKPGLLKAAEEIVAAIASAKKDLKKLSEAIRRFSKDLFWYVRDSYSAWFGVLVAYSIKACDRPEATFRERAVANVLSLIELPLESDSDSERVRMPAEIWLRETGASSVPLGYRFLQARRVLTQIHERFPGADAEAAMQALLFSLRGRVTAMPALNDRILKALGEHIGDEDLLLLSKYGERNRQELVSRLAAAEAMVRNKEVPAAFEVLGDIGAVLESEGGMADTFFGVVQRNIAAPSARRFSAIVYEALSLQEGLPRETYERMIGGVTGFVRYLLAGGMVDACADLLARIREGRLALREKIVLAPGIASAILNSGTGGLLESYADIVKEIVIPAPAITGFSDETWAEIVNPLHIERLSSLLGIISLDSIAFREVLVRVICNLFLTGVFIPDEKIFQREVSSYLNSAAPGKDFLLHYLLLKRLPVYHSEVGAAGRIRELTTEIDMWSNDQVLYFLRKQTHANASNLNIRLVGEIITSWVRNDAGPLGQVVPGDVMQRVNADLLAQYHAAIRPFFESVGVLDTGGLRLERIVAIPGADLERKLKEQGLSEEIQRKVFLICRIYQEIVRKYSPSAGGAGQGDPYTTLARSLSVMGELKARIVSPAKTAATESLYFKRHIAFGIPSVMGTYHEPKFDAMGELLRKEEEFRGALETITSAIEGGGADFSPGDVPAWIDCLENVNTLFVLHDLANFQVDEVLAVLKTNRLRISQVMDLIRIWQRELAWMVESLHRTFYGPLAELLRRFPRDELSPHLRGLAASGEDFVDKAADIVFRDMMSSIAGFLEQDRLLNGLISVIRRHTASGADEEVAAAEAPQGEYFVLPGLPDPEAMRLGPLIGGKAKNLVYVKNAGLRVPPAAVLSSRMTSRYDEYTESRQFSELLKRAVGEIEALTGATFGGKKDPLFLSVRSGSYISMPGILSTILYCGINRKTLEGFIAASGNAWLGWDSCRRFTEQYSAVVYGLERGILEEKAETFMRGRGLSRREDLNADQMAEIVALYGTELEKIGLNIPEDVYEQLKESVKAVYRSWYTEQAVQFRKAMNVSEHWGTSVMLMQMIYGNDSGCGASVFFTRNPSAFEKGVYGETRERAMGSDIVLGRSLNTPLSKKQASPGQRSLEESDPDLFSMHERLAQGIEEAMRGLPQEVEAVYTRRPGGERTISTLQTRRMEVHRGFTKMFHDVCNMQAHIIGRGAGIHGGALSGVATFSEGVERIRELRRESGLRVILLRKMASTQDVALMPEVDGIVTATGGVASHAAVLAQKFDLAAVVGCSAVEIRTGENGEPYAVIGDYTVTEGAPISIDGSTGLVYSGLCLMTVEKKG